MVQACSLAPNVPASVTKACDSSQGRIQHRCSRRNLAGRIDGQSTRRQSRASDRRFKTLSLSPLRIQNTSKNGRRPSIARRLRITQPGQTVSGNLDTRARTVRTSVEIASPNSGKLGAMNLIIPLPEFPRVPIKVYYLYVQ